MPARNLLLAWIRNWYDAERRVLLVPPAAAVASCPVYRPDHNGECLLCDEGADAHTEAAIEAGEREVWARFGGEEPGA